MGHVPRDDPPLTLTAQAYLNGFDQYLRSETLWDRLQGRITMDGTLPFLLAERRAERILDARYERRRLEEVGVRDAAPPADEALMAIVTAEP